MLLILLCRELDDGWHVIIQDAILEKCNDAGANIVHISVDMSSSEVTQNVLTSFSLA